VIKITDTLELVYDVRNRAIPFARMRDGHVYFRKPRSQSLIGHYPGSEATIKSFRVPFGIANVVLN
jgi:hypothetical protein